MKHYLSHYNRRLPKARPSRATVYRWRSENTEFRKAFSDARDSQCHAIAEDAVKEAQMATNDWQAARLRFDAKRWLVSKLLPRVFGDRPDQDAGDAAQPVTVLVQRFGPEIKGQMAIQAAEFAGRELAQETALTLVEEQPAVAPASEPPSVSAAPATVDAWWNRPPLRTFGEDGDLYQR